jgi:hypothetical protein
MVSGIGDGITALLKLLLIICIVAIPFAIWKIVELIIWLINNVSIHVS